MSDVIDGLPFSASVSKKGGGHVDLPVKTGTPLFIVGPNGSGKSGLMHQLYTSNRERSVRISAQRANTLQGNAVPFSPADKIVNENNARGQDAQPTARFSEWSAEMRNGLILADLIEADNAISRKVREAMQSRDVTTAAKLAAEPPPLSRISELMMEAGISISLIIGDSSSVLASKNGSEPYSIAALSDGERAALLTAGRILTAKSGQLVLVDEPERHLHSSITTPLLARLFALRPDCAFVITTHELELPAAFPESRTALVRDSEAAGVGIIAWDLDILEPDASIDDDLKITILGSRRKILFAEGRPASLDRPLYEIIFPGVSVQPKETSSEVRKHVEGVRGAASLHWVQSFGIVDQDQITETSKADLIALGIHPIAVYSVEGLYYHPHIQRMIADRQVELVGGNADTLLKGAEGAVISSLSENLDRMAARMTEQVVKDALTKQFPDWKKISAGAPVNITVDAVALLNAEKCRAVALLAARDVVGIVARYPLRETGALGLVAQKLGFKDRSSYEAAVRKLAKDRPEARRLLRSFFGALPAELGIPAE